MKKFTNVLCMVFLCCLWGCGDRVENSIKPDVAVQAETSKAPGQKNAAAVQQASEGASATQGGAPAGAPGGSGAAQSPDEEEVDEEKEALIEMMSERLDAIMDEYYENDEEDTIDADTLLARLKQSLPPDQRDDIPEEIMEEIEWWAE